MSGPASVQQDSVYSSRAAMAADQGYNRSISTVSNPENMYSSRAQMAADMNYKRCILSLIL